MTDHTVPDSVIPERTSSLAATTSLKAEALALDFDNLALGLAVQVDQHEHESPAPRNAVGPLTAESAAASLPPIPSSSDTQLGEFLARTADQVSEQFESTEDDREAPSNVERSMSVPESSTAVDITTATPVVHETVKVEHHEIIQKVVTREIHEYHEYTRILPVVETTLLPARHFIMTKDGRKVECALSDIPVGDTASTITYHVSGDSLPAELTTAAIGDPTEKATVKPG